MAERLEQMMARVPVGTRTLLDEYVSIKAQEDPTDKRYSATNGRGYRPSAAAFIRYLIEKELDIDLTSLPDDANEIRQIAGDKARNA